MSTSERPLLAAALIVRDEGERLAACLASLTGLTDEIHVYDTGSVDGTPELAESLGARVTRGPWTDDFAAARNAAQQGWTADWVLSIDADHRCLGNPARLRGALETSVAGFDALAVDIDNAHDELPYTHTEARLYRPDVARWRGRVHERLVTDDGERPRTAELSRDLLVLKHDGYADNATRVAKSVRNLALARRTLDELAATGFDADRDEFARTLLVLGRSQLGAGQKQASVDTFEAVRDLFPGTPEWLEATDFLARLVLAAGMDDACLFLAEQLREAGAPGPYCNVLAAQALAQLGDATAASAMLAGVTEVVDLSGRRRDPRFLAELHELVERLVVSSAR